MKKKGFIISFEGIDGCGKTTQARLFYEYLKNKGTDVILLNEPGGTYAGEKIREVILDKKGRVSPLSELLLYIASRAQLVAEVIRPAVSAGTDVILDRYIDSTSAYQGYGRKLPLDLIGYMHRFFMKGVAPDITFLIDDSAENLAGVLGKKDRDRIERESIGFQKSVRIGYLQIAKRNRKRIKVVKRKSMECTHKGVIKEWESFKDGLKRKQGISSKHKKEK